MVHSPWVDFLPHNRCRRCSTCESDWPGEDRFFTFTVNLIDDLPQKATTGGAAAGKRQKKEAAASDAPAPAPEKQLVEAFRSAMATEYLTDANCSHCNEKRTVERSYKLKAPLSPVFLIEVSRIAYDRQVRVWSVDYRCEGKKKKLASLEATLVSLLSSRLNQFLSENPDNQSTAKEMHLKIPLLSRGLKLSDLSQIVLV
jgi:hypothetical protein